MGHQRRRPTTTRTSRRYPSTGTIAYQGRLADSAGTPITETVNMEFRLYDVADGGAPLWSELWTGSNAVRVSDGLFNVMLGSLEPIPQAVVAGHDQLYLGITVGTDDEMMPRVQLGSVPFAVQALTVPDGSVSTAKLADNAVTSAKVEDGQVKTADLANGAVTQNKFSDIRIYVAEDGISVDSEGRGCKLFSLPNGRFTETPHVFPVRRSIASWEDNNPAFAKARFVVNRIDKTSVRICVDDDRIYDGVVAISFLAVQTD